MLETLRTTWNRLAEAVYRRFVLRLLRHRTRAALEALPDYLLEDIGLVRADIPAVVEAMIARETAAAARCPQATREAEPAPALRRAA